MVFGFESGIVVSLVGIAILFLFCAIIGVVIWVAGLLAKEKKKPPKEKPLEEKKKSEGD